ncbi:SulP family sulfate permease [Aliiruegeria haliotis]|uniref:SulP family sulfate permease n=1 Tax=Aliiruegeria haliotis TaxID=1280846 RepID=A0A2T0RPB8_9RHOB|nr:SulP family inorganic anion transporter [Aliiruegeria haliotis]PRY22950.1 SulP family sulfate permease [Aliiruegeria haliotis]
MAQTADNAHSRVGPIGLVLSGTLVGLTSVVFAISFAAIIYNDRLAPFLERGIAHTLLGASIMAAIGAFLFSYRGTIGQPQDITAILLAGAAATIAAGPVSADPEVLYTTVFMMVAIAAVAAGAVCVILGTIKVSFLARFTPYPVLGAFLASTGYFLTMGAIGLVLGRNVTIWDMGFILAPQNLAAWAPWVILGGAMDVAIRKVPGNHTLPVCILGAAAAFFVYIYAAGIGLEGAEARGWLLGPFPEAGFLGEIGRVSPSLTDWPAIATQVPVLLAVIGMTLLGGMLNLTGLELTIGEDLEIDRDLRTIGVTNIATGGVGGLVGYPLLGETIFAWRIGLKGTAAGVSAALTCLVTFLFGADVLALMPKGLLAAVVAFLGLDLLRTWLWHERQKLPWQDFLVILLTLAVAATIGFLEALAFGLCASVVVFIVSYARLNIVRSVSDLRERRSTVERSAPQATCLSGAGDRVLVVELAGHLFFGSGAGLRKAIWQRINTPVALDMLILDFNHVSGIDSSTILNLNRMRSDCDARGIELALSGCSAFVADRIARFNIHHSERRLVHYPTLNDALEVAEERILAQTPPAADVDGLPFLDELARRHPALDLASMFKTLDCSDGDIVLRQNDCTNGIFVLLQGQVRATISMSGPNDLEVARFLPGSLIGEIASYGEVERTATVSSIGSSRLMRIDLAHIDEADALSPGFAADFHRLVARRLARRLRRTTLEVKQTLDRQSPVGQ